ncbi:MAG: RodZ domain-containing protein [Sphingomonas sp.]
MTSPDPGEEATLFPKSAGERLREAREAQGLSLAEIAARTRVPLRQLEAIENSDYAQLPSVTYAVGFAKSYARAVGIDEVAVAREVRGTNDQNVRRTEYEVYEISDPKRVPSRGIALFGVFAALLLLIAAGIWFGTNWFRGDDSAPPPAPIAETVPGAAPSPVPTNPAAGGGQVTLTASDDVWLRVYDAAGKTLFQNTLKPGEHYDVPPEANGPMINVGRPDKLQVMVNGTAMAPLGTGKVAIKDVGISAAALIARPAGSAVTPAVAPTTPTSRAKPAARPSAGAAPRSEIPALNIAAPASQPAPATAATPSPQ